MDAYQRGCHDHFTNVRLHDVLYILPLFLKDPLELSVKRMLVSRFLSRRDET